MNIASKITSLPGANKISIGENVYKSLDHKTQREFHELSMSDDRWKYINYGTDGPYKVYTLSLFFVLASRLRLDHFFLFCIFYDGVI